MFVCPSVPATVILTMWDFFFIIIFQNYSSQLTDTSLFATNNRQYT